MMVMEKYEEGKRMRLQSRSGWESESGVKERERGAETVKER
jgi:hypothetical protein